MIKHHCQLHFRHIATGLIISKVYFPHSVPYPANESKRLCLTVRDFCKMGLVLGILIIQEVLDELLPGFEGTIAEYEDFDAEADCNALNDAIDRVKMDTDTVIDILCNRCNTQRMDIRGNYEGLYGEDLYDVCKRIRRDDLRHVVRGLLCTPIEYDAKCIRKALKGPERGPIIARV